VSHCEKPCAVLLVGPTGSGKTPLGDLIERRGLGPNRYRHFDFGAQLRAIVQRDQPDERFSRSDLDFLGRVLQTGALLENEHFALAERILLAFLAQPETVGSRIILNGLPRHVGQAQAVDRLVNVEGVIALECTSDTVRQRIATNAGGDRTERKDDDREAVERKLRLYAERTEPLVEYYRGHGARVERIAVTAATSPEDAWQQVQSRRLGMG